MHLPRTALRVLGELFLGMEFDFSEIPQKKCPQARWGRVKALQYDPAGRSEVQLAGLSDPQAGVTLLERVFILSGLEGLSLYVLSSRRETSELPVTSLWPRLQLVLGYFLSQMAYPGKQHSFFILRQEREAA